MMVYYIKIKMNINFLQKHVAYPKLVLLGLTIAASYFLFQLDFFEEFARRLNSHGLVAMFIGGMMFAFGFTAPLAVGLFWQIASDVELFPAAVVGGFGGLIADFFIFRFMRVSFIDEFERLKMTWIIQKIKYLFDNHLSDRLRQYVLWTFAGLLIASPLPDEFGVPLLSGFTKLNSLNFAVIAFVLDTLGVAVILILSRGVS